ncbi:MAG: hypothetical protein MZV70_65600 [Desulfobacterales bacterium]|nr:hypothetical protein [Desulfobacterales bacterium]
MERSRMGYYFQRHQAAAGGGPGHGGEYLPLQAVRPHDQRPLHGYLRRRSTPCTSCTSSRPPCSRWTSP